MPIIKIRFSVSPITFFGPRWHQCKRGKTLAELNAGGRTRDPGSRALSSIFQAGGAVLVFARQAGGKRPWPRRGNFELFNMMGVNTQLLAPWETGWLLMLITRTSRNGGREGWGLESLPVRKSRGKKKVGDIYS